MLTMRKNWEEANKLEPGTIMPMNPITIPMRRTINPIKKNVRIFDMQDTILT